MEKNENLTEQESLIGRNIAVLAEAKSVSVGKWLTVLEDLVYQGVKNHVSDIGLIDTYDQDDASAAATRALMEIGLIDPDQEMDVAYALKYAGTVAGMKNKLSRDASVDFIAKADRSLNPINYMNSKLSGNRFHTVGNKTA